MNKLILNTFPQIIRRFNDRAKGYIRLRICEKCGILTFKNHWSKNDIVTRDLSKLLVDDAHHRYYTEKIKYGHIWLCHDCFYGKLLGLK